MGALVAAPSRWLTSPTNGKVGYDSPPPPDTANYTRRMPTTADISNEQIVQRGLNVHNYGVGKLLAQSAFCWANGSTELAPRSTSRPLDTNPQSRAGAVYGSPVRPLATAFRRSDSEARPPRLRAAIWASLRLRVYSRAGAPSISAARHGPEFAAHKTTHKSRTTRKTRSQAPNMGVPPFLTGDSLRIQRRRPIITRVGDRCGGEESNATMRIEANGQKGSEIDGGAAIIDTARTRLNTQRPLAAPSASIPGPSPTRSNQALR